jgi:hypothetical protein
MTLTEQRERWERMLAQAAQLAACDHTLDAVSHARTCADEIRDALSGATDPETRNALVRFEQRARRRLDAFEKAHEGFMARVSDRAAAFREREHDVYEEELPVKGLG